MYMLTRPPYDDPCGCGSILELGALELVSRFSVCEVSGHPRETISPYESDSERGNKTAASERRERERERLKHHQHKYRTNGA